MSGAVFHPGHEGLHGFTVLVRMRDGGVVAGRYDRTVNGVTRMLGACSAEAGAPAAALLSSLRVTGPRPDVAELMLDAKNIEAVVPFGDWLRSTATAG